MSSKIDLNCDMGESYGAWKIGDDAGIMPHVTSANIACGAHAGDPSVMLATVALAKAHDVAIGAHPGFPDLPGFGRRPMALTADEIYAVVLTQLGAIAAIARASGAELHHVKPHGALYNLACADFSVAVPVVRAVRHFSQGLAIYCLPSSFLYAETESNGLFAVAEGFADRAYEPNGSLADRKLAEAVKRDPHAAAEQALQLANGTVLCRDGTVLPLSVDTLCIHGDTPGAAEIAREVRAALLEAGFQITSALNA
jgi:UPF0271 protein